MTHTGRATCTNSFRTSHNSSAHAHAKITIYFLCVILFSKTPMYGLSDTYGHEKHRILIPCKSSIVQGPSVPLACPLLKTWLLLQCSSLISLWHHSAMIEIGGHWRCTAHAPWLSFQAVSLCSVTRDIRSGEDCAYLALFPLHCNPQFINKTPFSRAPITLGLHRNSKFTSRNRTQKYTKTCSCLDFTAGSQCLSLQKYKLQGPARCIYGFPNLPTLSFKKEKRQTFVSGFHFERQAVMFLLWVKNKDEHIFLISQNENKRECTRGMKMVLNHSLFKQTAWKMTITFNCVALYFLYLLSRSQTILWWYHRLWKQIQANGKQASFFKLLPVHPITINPRIYKGLHVMSCCLLIQSGTPHKSESPLLILALFASPSSGLFYFDTNHLLCCFTRIIFNLNIIFCKTRVIFSCPSPVGMETNWGTLWLH